MIKTNLAVAISVQEIGGSGSFRSSHFSASTMSAGAVSMPTKKRSFEAMVEDYASKMPSPQKTSDTLGDMQANSQHRLAAVVEGCQQIQMLS